MISTFLAWAFLLSGSILIVSILINLIVMWVDSSISDRWSNKVLLMMLISGIVFWALAFTEGRWW